MVSSRLSELLHSFEILSRSRLIFGFRLNFLFRVHVFEHVYNSGHGYQYGYQHHVICLTYCSKSQKYIAVLFFNKNNRYKRPVQWLLEFTFQDQINSSAFKSPAANQSKACSLFKSGYHCISLCDAAYHIVAILRAPLYRLLFHHSKMLAFITLTSSK